LLSLAENQRVRVSDVAASLGVARSTAHRLLAMLEYRGFVARDPGGPGYVPGPALLQSGLAALHRRESWWAARPVIERLSSELQESVHFGILEGAEVLFVDGVESPRPLRAGSRVGVRLPAHCTAAGKAMLSTMSVEEVRRRLPARLVARTTRSITRREDLERELEQVRRVNFATNFGESEEDLVAVAAPVQPMGCIVVTAPASRAKRRTWVGLVAAPTVSAAQEITARLKSVSV
jgi:IclR family acetate operon transcriptional repressor